MRVLRRVIVLLLLFGAIAAGYFYRDYARFADAALAPLAKPTTVDVAFGTPLPRIVTDLQAQGIRTGLPLYWRLLARQMDVAGKLHAGEYALEPGITPRALLAKMAAGKVIQHKFTIVEGWTFAQLRMALSNDKEITEVAMVGEPFVPFWGKELMQKLGEPGLEPEGQFLPETYNFVKGETDIDILQRAHKAMKQTLDKLWNSRAQDLPLHSPYEALILASIVEKETAQPAERGLIAGVFEHRLKLGMRLQTDPTVIYGLGPNYDGKIHTRDLQTDTPYNTYTRAGLPPTPIALPGAASIEAVLHPAPTDALYFVARGDGTHEFSATLEAHNRAVAKYQLHRQ
ncbi:MAG: endolytic transglycosylase MltG [Proteobacteria bacterium]|nr:endolytic transglycosylase MltG [Pseudomonadota bacterium]